MTADLRIIARQIKDRITVAEAASWYGYTYREGDRNECPKCSTVSTSRKTLAVYEGGRWYCFHCSEGGDVIDWLAAQQRTSKGEAIMRLASRLGITGDLSELVLYLKEKMSPKVRADLAREAAYSRAAREVRRCFYDFHSRSTVLKDSVYAGITQRFWDLEWMAMRGDPQAVDAAKQLVSGRAPLTGSESETARLYRFNEALAQRFSANVPAQAVKRFGPKSCDYFGIGYAPAGFRIPPRHAETAQLLGLLTKKSKLPLMRGRMVFPVRDIAGRVVAFGARRMEEDGSPKYINTGDSPIFSKRRMLYGLHQSLPYIVRRRYVVVVEGYGAVIALARHGIRNVVASLGTALTEDQADLLARFVRDAVLLFDPDDAGTRAARKADIILRASRMRTGRASLPPPCDPEDAVNQSGPGPVLRAILDALPGYPTDPADPLGLGNFRRRVRAPRNF